MLFLLTLKCVKIMLIMIFRIALWRLKLLSIVTKCFNLLDSMRSHYI